MRRAQAAIEFMVLSGFMILVFSTFFLVVQQRSQVLAEQNRLEEVSRVSDRISDEIRIAGRVRPGYERTFVLPPLIDEDPYTVQLIPLEAPSEVIITYGDGEEYVTFLDVNLTSGSSIIPGKNLIRKPPNGSITVSGTQ